MPDFVVAHEVTFRIAARGISDALTAITNWLTARGGQMLLQNPEVKVGTDLWDLTLILSLPNTNTTLAGALTAVAGQYTGFPANTTVRTIVQGAVRRADIVAQVGSVAVG